MERLLGALVFDGFKIIERPLELHRFSILLKAYISNRLPGGWHTINERVLVHRESVAGEEFFIVKTNQHERALNKVSAMELQSILEKFLSRIDIFDLPRQ